MNNLATVDLYIVDPRYDNAAKSWAKIAGYLVGNARVERTNNGNVTLAFNGKPMTLVSRTYHLPAETALEAFAETVAGYDLPVSAWVAKVSGTTELATANDDRLNVDIVNGRVIHYDYLGDAFVILNEICEKAWPRTDALADSDVITPEMDKVYRKVRRIYAELDVRRYLSENGIDPDTFENLENVVDKYDAWQGDNEHWYPAIGYIIDNI